MDEVRKSLTKQERVILADFWEDKDKIHALEKALLQRQFNLAVTTVASALNWENVLDNRGEIKGSKWIITFLKHNHATEVKLRKTANNNAKSA